MKHGDSLSTDLKSSDHNRRGSAGAVGSMQLLKSYKSMHAPFTQVFFYLLESGPFDILIT